MTFERSFFDKKVSSGINLTGFSRQQLLEIYNSADSLIMRRMAGEALHYSFFRNYLNENRWMDDLILFVGAVAYSYIFNFCFEQYFKQI